MKLAEKIKSKRLELSLRQQEVASRARVSPEYIGKIERGEITNVGIKTLEKILKALGLTLADIFSNRAA